MIRTGKPSRRAVLAGIAANTTGLTAPWIIDAARAAGTLRIGHLTDGAGPYSANSGAVSIACARQAIEEFNPATKGMSVAYVIGEQQNSTDIALNVVHVWW